MNMKNKISILLLVLSLSLNFCFATGYDNFKIQKDYDDSIFGDVKADQWYYDNVKTAYQYGLINGKLYNTFDPDGDLTLAETIKLAATLRSVYTGKAIPIKETGQWYESYVDFALDEGIIKELNGKLDAPIKRIEFASIFAKALPSQALRPINRIDDGLIPDLPITDSHAPDVYNLYRAGVITGSNEEGVFLPKTNIKRREVATILTRMAIPANRKTITLINPYTVSGYIPTIYPLHHTMYVGEEGFLVFNDKEGKIPNVAIVPINNSDKYISASWGKWHAAGDNIILAHLKAIKAGQAQYYVRSLDENDQIIHEQLLKVNILAELPSLDKYHAPDFVKIFNPYIVNENTTDNSHSISFQPSSLKDKDYQNNSLESYRQMLKARGFSADPAKSNSQQDYFIKIIDGITYSVLIDYSQEKSNLITIKLNKE